MIAQFFKPHPALQHMVHNIMVSGNTLPSATVMPVTPFPPMAQHALYFYVHDRVNTQFFGDKDYKLSPRSTIIGPHLLRVNIKLGYDMLVVRVGFQPGGLRRLVGFPMHEILDYVCDSTAVFGNAINETLDKLNDETDAAGMKNIVEAFLLQRIRYERSPFTESIKYLSQQNGNIPVSQLAYQTGLSVRQFERKCNQYLGFSPKVFSRITRFSKAYRMREKFPTLSWTAIAYQCGYFDQMHFIRDFKEFAGVTPTFMENELALTPFRLQTDISY